MHPTHLRILITGVALLIFGPCLGYLLTLLGFFRQVSKPSPEDLASAFRALEQFPADMTASLFPVVIGITIGSLGLFLIAFSLIKHFLAPPIPIPATSPLPPPRPSPTSPLPQVRVHQYPPFAPPSAPPAQDDSRYMPKS